MELKPIQWRGLKVPFYRRGYDRARGTFPVRNDAQAEQLDLRQLLDEARNGDGLGVCFPPDGRSTRGGHGDGRPLFFLDADARPPETLQRDQVSGWKRGFDSRFPGLRDAVLRALLSHKSVVMAGKSRSRGCWALVWGVQSAAVLEHFEAVVRRAAGKWCRANGMRQERGPAWCCDAQDDRHVRGIANDPAADFGDAFPGGLPDIWAAPAVAPTRDECRRAFEASAIVEGARLLNRPRQALIDNAALWARSPGMGYAVALVGMVSRGRLVQAPRGSRGSGSVAQIPHCVVLAKSNAGKSWTFRHILEPAVRAAGAETLFPSGLKTAEAVEKTLHRYGTRKVKVQAEGADGEAETREEFVPTPFPPLVSLFLDEAGASQADARVNQRDVSRDSALRRFVDGDFRSDDSATNMGERYQGAFPVRGAVIEASTPEAWIRTRATEDASDGRGRRRLLFYLTDQELEGYDLIPNECLDEDETRGELTDSVRRLMATGEGDRTMDRDALDLMAMAYPALFRLSGWERDDMEQHVRTFACAAAAWAGRQEIGRADVMAALWLALCELDSICAREEMDGRRVVHADGLDRRAQALCERKGGEASGADLRRAVSKWAALMPEAECCNLADLWARGAVSPADPAPEGGWRSCNQVPAWKAGPGDPIPEHLRKTTLEHARAMGRSGDGRSMNRWPARQPGGEMDALRSSVAAAAATESGLRAVADFAADALGDWEVRTDPSGGVRLVEPGKHANGPAFSIQVRDGRLCAYDHRAQRGGDVFHLWSRVMTGAWETPRGQDFRRACADLAAVLGVADPSGRNGLPSNDAQGVA